MVKNKLNR